jgi:pSer/pThr/pTyr-binding forkhead associated (FHA) protein
MMIAMAIALFTASYGLCSQVLGLTSDVASNLASALVGVIGAVVVGQRTRGPLGHVVVDVGPDKGNHEVGSDVITIGRSGRADISLPHDEWVSEVHARLEWRSGRWFIEDLNSLNGTYINGNRIAQRERLHYGTRVRIGMSIFDLRRI